METFVLMQTADILLILVWMTGGVLIVREFLRDYGGTKYEVGHAGAFTGDFNPDIEVHDTEGFQRWQAARRARIKRGIVIFSTGVGLQLLSHLFTG